MPISSYWFVIDLQLISVREIVQFGCHYHSVLSDLYLKFRSNPRWTKGSSHQGNKSCCLIAALYRFTVMNDGIDH